MTTFPPLPLPALGTLAERRAERDRQESVRHSVDVLAGYTFVRFTPQARRRHALEIMLRSLHRQARHLGIEGVTYADLRAPLLPAEPEPHPALFDPRPTCSACGARGDHRIDCPL